VIDTHILLFRVNPKSSLAAFFINTVLCYSWFSAGVNVCRRPAS